MYSGIKITNSELDKNDPMAVVHYYQLFDDDIDQINKFFSIKLIRNASGWDDVSHTNDILYNLFYIYKYSKFPACHNFRRILEFTFPTKSALGMIKKTEFYKNNKFLIESSLKC